MFNFLKKKCPQCEQRNVITIKETFWGGFKRGMVNIALPWRIVLGTGKKPKDTYVCRGCNFKWDQK